MVSCSGFPTKPRTGSSVCKTVLLGYSRTQSRGSTSLPPSSTYTGCRSSPAYSTSPSMPLPPSTYRTSFTHMPHPGTCGPQTLACLPPPHTKLRTFGDRAFSVAAPTLWSALPAEIRNIPTLDAFKRALKSHLFAKAFGP
ncbi:hypothetical protein CesoFtcFv8_001377 [Champsocephalus esox]|uniref:Uncharacterized protein n=1 Tax=Champsocephalus esox TaxID=159716 RepID=A0AAN8D6Z3_9TELE|nr:hypothetical protein CesoFtcFv8_001377 [Champsocephalus esox]